MLHAAFAITTALLLTAAAPPVAPAGNAPPADSITFAPARPDSAATQAVVTLHYFHRTSRCETCLAIEAMIDEALRTHFAEALESGRLAWRPVNVETPGNEHFVADFALEANAAILVLPDAEPDGRTWEELDRVWELVESRKEFLEYVRDRVDAALGVEPRAGVRPAAKTGTDPESR